MCEKTFSNGKLANQVILVKYRISVSDTPKVAKVHGIHLVKLLSKRKFCIKKTKTISWFFNPKCYHW